MPNLFESPRGDGETARAAGSVCGLVLCGGRSGRMGFDKALAPLAGRALIERPLAALDQVCTEVLLACGSEPRYAELGRPLALDPFPDGGPLAGLCAGLEEAARRGFEWVLVLACDMPRAEVALLRALLERARARSLDACLLELPRGSQPMYAVYRSRIAPAVRAALERGERRMVAFHGERAGGAALRVETLAARSRGAEASAANLNTPRELGRERLAEEREEDCVRAREREA